jgi:hypothetical protein
MELAEVEVRYGLSVNLFFVAYYYTKTYGTGTPKHGIWLQALQMSGYAIATKGGPPRGLYQK